MFFKHIKTENLLTELAFVFLKSSSLKLGTKGFFMETQDGICNILVTGGLF